jgi:cell division protease FtsH
LVTLLGGRAAEEEVFGEGYSGAADDLTRVHQICVQMVTEFGMTPAQDQAEPAPLAVPTGDYALSDETRRDVDLNAQELARMAYTRARQLVSINRRCLDDLAANALERETLSREDLDNVFAAHKLERRLVPELEAEPLPDVGERREPRLDPAYPLPTLDIADGG